MNRLLRAIRDVLSSRFLPPLVIGFFFLLYVGIAFVTEETLTALMEFTRTSFFLSLLLALLPVNCAIRLVKETDDYLKRRRAMTEYGAHVPPELFDETVEISAPSSMVEQQERLETEGYKTRRRDNALLAWRGINIFPARVFFLAGTFCLFAGILISLTSRISHRGAVVEGEPLPSSAGGGGKVERIILAKSPGLFLDRTLTMEVAPSITGEGRRTFGLYPPSFYGGAFVYPRYLGVALLIRLSAPGVPSGYELHAIPNIYPPGKEDSVEIPDSPYRIVVSMAEPESGQDPFVSGHITLLFKLLKGKEALFSGSAPVGGEFARDGYRLAFPDCRRMAVTDFIRDYGVLLVWTAAIFFIVSALIWLPIRFFFPRREMFFVIGEDMIRASSRAEGRERRHAGIFHELLDLLERRPPSSVK